MAPSTAARSTVAPFAAQDAVSAPTPIEAQPTPAEEAPEPTPAGQDASTEAATDNGVPGNICPGHGFV